MEAADSTTNSSKVIVQCHDPNGLFDSIVNKLNPRLPLSKLHWKSPNRPLRSIDQLNVAFLQDDSKSEATASARRHQIPGLRQTPFVKVYLVRCDDREVYKETCRKDIKQWLKSQGISQDGKTLMKGQERHDAYEYIILHVVLPGTAAAAQPKSSKHISVEASESTDSVNSKSKWTGKSSSTVFDKLRADFSSSSKAPFERVAQVRITDSSNKQPVGLGPSEIEEQWQDFVEKLKTAILLSFDARVSQYEEDIRDREAQRQLPGWNFCTFFVLKEGLARGFENVGLIEDSLTVYDELDAGLDTVVQEQATRQDADPTGDLLPFSSDLKPAIRSALDELGHTHEDMTPDASALDLPTIIDLERKSFPFDIEQRDYQQRILTNQVSALEFHIYIFTRQLQLLFRQAKIHSAENNSQTNSASSLKAQHDLDVVAEICEKATSFITFAARALRRDLYAAWGGQQGLSDDELKSQQIVVGGIVASWKWSAIMQILADCRVLMFLQSVLHESSQGPADGDQTIPEVITNGQSKVSNEDLALWAGELFVMARDVIQTTILSDNRHQSDNTLLQAFRSRSLHLLSCSKNAASDAYTLLTTYAYRCFCAADRINASHSMLHSLARLEFDADRVDQAVSWLEHIPDLSNLNARTATDRTLLKFYAECLKIQGRLEDYFRAIVGLLLCTVSNPFARAIPRYDEQSQHIFNELVDVSQSISDVELQLDEFFTIHDVSKTIMFVDNVPGFKLSVSLSLRFNASVDINSFELILMSVGGQDPTYVSLTRKDNLVLNGSVVNVDLSSNTITEGWYNLDRLVLTIGRVTIVHHFQSTSTAGVSRDKPLPQIKPAPIMLYPHSGTFLVKVRASPLADLTKPGHLLFEIWTGKDDIEECLLRLRPATAGVRLNIQAATSVVNDHVTAFDLTPSTDPTVLILSDLEHSSTKLLTIPYTTESLTNVVDVKTEAVCQSSNGEFSAFYRRSVTVNLPISINVQDIFQAGRLFSRFTASPSTFIPLQLLNWSVEDTSDFEVYHANVPQTAIDVFPRAPASWIVEAISKVKPRPKLPLVVQYQSYDDLILNNIESQFRQDINDTPLGFATELLVSHLLKHLPSAWTAQDLEAAALLQEFMINSFDSFYWDDTLRALGTADRKSAEDWLRSWHEHNLTVVLDLQPIRTREVKLSVDMPVPPMVVSTSLDLIMTDKHYLTVGDAVAATLTIQMICSMSLRADIQFDLTSQPDTWLIGGKKRGVLEAKESLHTFNVMLVAQKTGHLLLPIIDIRYQQASGSGNANHADLEVESRSQAKSVLVIPDLKATTIAMGTNESNGRYWPVDMRRR